MHLNTPLINCIDVLWLVYLYITGPPVVFDPPEDFFAVEGDNVTFDCGAYGTPFPSTQWTFNGVELQDETKYTVDELGANLGQLTIRNVTFSDEGVYICNISNSIRTLLVNAQLFIQGLRVLS